MADTDPVVIIGTGHAGYTLAREFRKLDPQTPLHLISRDAGDAYYKPNLSKALAMGKQADALVQQAAEVASGTIDATLHANTEVIAIDPAAHTLQMGDTTLRYSRLVLATGASPIRLPALGDTALSVNDLDDYRAFREGLTEGAHVLIAGGGLIGCEFANDLAASGCRVTVVDIAEWPLPKLLPEAQGRVLQAALEGLGVQFRLGVGVETIKGNTATLADGSTIAFDTLLSAIGLAPNTQLARAAGLACGRGITVDACFATTAPDIYALGDCVDVPAEHAPQPMPYILPIAHAARALAKTLTGEATPVTLPAMPVMVKTPACPTLVCPPLQAEGSWQVSGDAPDLEAVFVDKDGRESGFALTGAATKKRGEYAARMPSVRD